MSDKKFIATLVYAFLVLLLIETALQFRAELRHGNSIFSAFKFPAQDKEQLFYSKGEYRLLTPGVIREAREISISANTLGLRDAEKNLNEHDMTNIVVLGASTVYGAFAKTNQSTFPSLLEKKLVEQGFPEVQVINAGIPGNTIKAQFHLYDDLFANKPVSALIVYPGFTNMLAKACRNNKENRNDFPALSLPKWILSYDLLLKNTVYLRYRKFDQIVSEPIDTSIQEETFTTYLNKIIELALDSGVRKIYLVENQKAFHEGQSLDDQRKNASTIFYYAECFGLSEFNQAYKRMNKIMSDSAKEYDSVEYIPFNDKMSGKESYFSDSIHFSLAGELVVSEVLFSYLMQDWNNFSQ